GRGVGAGEELAHDAALPETRVPVDGEHVRTPVADRACECVVEQVELRLAADERRADVSDALAPVADADRSKCRDGLAEAAKLERACGLRVDRGTREPVRGLAD